MSIGDRIQEIRRDHSLSQSEFADKFEISLTSLSTYERDKKLPPVSLFTSIYENWGIDISWMMTGEGFKSKELDGANIKNAYLKMLHFTRENGIELEPKPFAKIVVLIIDLLNEGHSIDSALIKNVILTCSNSREPAKE